MPRMVYLDHAAATPLDPRVFSKMSPFLRGGFGNPSAIYGLGARSRDAVEEARKKIAEILSAQPDEIIFTGNATEANNLAVKGAAYARQHLGNHLIVSAIEHASVIGPCQELEKDGFKITYLPVDQFGLVSAEEIKNAVTPMTILVSAMYANNEIGTIEPVVQIGKTLLRLNQERVGEKMPTIYFHSDAVQAANFLELDIRHLHTDLLTLNASKIYGPKGVGMLYRKRGLMIHPQIMGGGQESGWRGGTENVAAIAGLAEALSLAVKNREKESRRLRALRDYFWQGLKQKIKGAALNGHSELRLPNNLHISIKGVDGEAMLLYLDEAGVQCSTGAACSLLEESGSRVLSAIGLPGNEITSSLRFSLGRTTAKKDIDYLLKIMPEIIRKVKIA